jgi:hypothetical protein
LVDAPPFPEAKLGMESKASLEVVVLARAWEFESPPSYKIIFLDVLGVYIIF